MLIRLDEGDVLTIDAGNDLVLVRVVGGVVQVHQERDFSSPVVNRDQPAVADLSPPPLPKEQPKPLKDHHYRVYGVAVGEYTLPDKPIVPARIQEKA